MTAATTGWVGDVHERLNTQFSFFYRATLYQRRICYGPVYVFVCHKSEYYQNGWKNRAGFWRGSFLARIGRKFRYLQKITCLYYVGPGVDPATERGHVLSVVCLFYPSARWVVIVIRNIQREPMSASEVTTLWRYTNLFIIIIQTSCSRNVAICSHYCSNLTYHTLTVFLCRFAINMWNNAPKI